jgi:hypothetical protein
MSNECAPHPNTFSYVPSVFVSAQFCATESTEKVFLCTEKVFLCVFFAQKGPQKGPQKHIRKNTISRHIHSTCLNRHRLEGAKWRGTVPHHLAPTFRSERPQEVTLLDHPCVASIPLWRRSHKLGVDQKKEKTKSVGGRSLPCGIAIFCLFCRASF